MAERKQVKKVNLKKPTKKSAPQKKASTKRPPQKIEMLPKKEPLRKEAEKETAKPEIPRNIAPKKRKAAANSRVKSSSLTYERKNEKASSPKQYVKEETAFKNNEAARLNVVKGNKLKNNRKKMAFCLVTLIIVASVIIISAASPTGILERFSNSFALMGSGEYPIAISGSKTFSVSTEGEKTFLLTDSHLSGYNDSGKTFIEYQHSFGNPVLKTSKERTLVYNRESTGFIVANNSEKVREGDVKNPIYLADIADCGYLAFATKSLGYAAEVKVYEEDMTEVFSWYLTDGFVTDIMLSGNGDYLAVAVLKVKNGAFVSQLTCFETDSTTPLYTKELRDQSVRALRGLNRDSFMALTDKKLMLLDFETGNVTERNESAFSPSIIKRVEDTTLAVFSENSAARIVLYDDEGVVLSNFEYNGLIDDITLYEDVVYILKGNKVTVMDVSGKSLTSLTLKQVSKNIIGNEKGVLVTDNLHISLVEYQKPEE